MTDETLLNQYAESAYKAHCEARNFKNLSGEPLWTWDEMPVDIQASWKAAVSDVMKHWDMHSIDRSNEFDLLTSNEWDVYDALSIAWNRFVALPVHFEGDRPDFANQINSLKNIVMSRAVTREMLKRGWSGYGE